MIEIFKDIKDLEGKYQVSNFGQILSLNYRHTGKPKLLKPVKHKNGYLFVNLGRKNIISIHRLVAEHFISNPNNLPCINHKDENKENNIVDNLEWCTREYNNNYGSHVERIRKANTNGKCSKKVLQFSKSGEFIKEWPSTAECSRNGYDFRNVSACCRGEIKSAYGYIWKYK